MDLRYPLAMPPTPETTIPRGIRTTEFWLSLALLVLLTASALLGLDLDALNATLAVIGYTVSRSASKLLPKLLPPIIFPPPPPPPPSASGDAEVSG